MLWLWGTIVDIGEWNLRIKPLASIRAALATVERTAQEVRIASACEHSSTRANECWEHWAQYAMRHKPPREELGVLGVKEASHVREIGGGAAPTRCRAAVALFSYP